MPANLGSAEYELTVDAQAFAAGFSKAEQIARTQTKAIADTIDRELKKVEASFGRVGTLKLGGSGGGQALAALRREIAAVEQKGITLKATVDTAAVRGAGGGGLNLSAIQGGLAGAGITLGASQAIGALSEGFQQVVRVTREAEQAQKALNTIYGQSAPLFQRIAQEQAAAANVSLTSTQAAVTQFATLRQNYGLTGQQIEQLTKLTLDYAAVSGKDVVDVSQRIQSALRGEAEAAEALGLTLNSDAVKAMANMTAEQRKNFETLDQVTKAQIIYNELMRQSVNVQGAAQKNVNTLEGSFNALNRESENLAKTLGDTLIPSIITFNRTAADAAKETAGWIKELRQLDQMSGGAITRGIGFAIAATGPTGTTRGFAGLLTPTQRPDFRPQAEREAEERNARDQAALTAAVSERIRSANTQRRAIAEETIRREIKAWEDGSKREIELIDERKQAVQDAAVVERQAIEDKRDADIKASQDAAEAAIRDLDARQQAAADYYDDQIEATERQRDADIRAIEARRDAAIKLVEEEQRALEEARRLEDRTREDTREGERRAIERNHDAALRALDEEQRGIERTRDAALRGIDERIDAEDRRHREAMANLDAEEAAALGIIDEELKELDRQARDEQRRETDRSLKQSLSEARRDVRTAETPEERRRAERAVADAERAIARERRNRQREDARELLRERREQVREEFAQRRADETERANIAREGLDAEKQRIADGTKAQLEALDERRALLQRAHEQALADLQDRYQQEDRLREDQRRKEDEAIAARLRTIREDADAEIQIVRDTATARIEALRDQAEATTRYYAEEKRKVQDAARAEQDEIRRTTDVNLRELQTRTQDLIRQLERDIRGHQEAAKRAVEVWRRAAADIQAYLSGAINPAYFVPSGTPGSGAGTRQLREGTSGGLQLPGGRMPTQREIDQYNAAQPVLQAPRPITQTAIGPVTTAVRPDQVDRYLESLGYDPSMPDYEDIKFRLIRDFDFLTDNERRQILSFARGGWIREPMLLSSLATGRPYAIAGEAGPEWVGPVASGGSGNGGSITIHAYDQRTQVDGSPALAAYMPTIARYVFGLLEHGDRVMADPAPDGLAGVEAF